MPRKKNSSESKTRPIASYEHRDKERVNNPPVALVTAGTDNGLRYLVYRGIIWREAKSWTPEDYERDAAFVDEQKLTDGAEEILVNGDSVIPGAQSLDGVFNARLFSFLEA